MAKNVNLTATGQAISNQPGVLLGVIVCSHSSGTLKLHDQPIVGNLGAVILDTYSFATGSQVILFPKSLEFYQGVYAIIGGTGVSIELIWSPDMSGVLA